MSGPGLADGVTRLLLGPSGDGENNQGRSLFSKLMNPSPSSKTKTAEDPPKPAMGRDELPGGKKEKEDVIVLVAGDGILKRK